MRIDIVGLGFRYQPPSGGEVLRDLNLRVESGSTHAIVGRSGCGKSTLLRLIDGRAEPTSGSVAFTGTPRHRHRTAMVFETPRLVPWWTVDRNVGIGVEFTDTPRSLYERLKDFYTSYVGVADLRERFAATLSGGQQSRVAFGRALAHDADVLLMDEPLANLDTLARRRLHIELEAILAADPRTTVLATCDIEEAVLLADRVSVMPSRPGPIVETVQVDAGRPRVAAGGELPGVRAAVVQVWDALEGA
jgi:ABC-type nitrate/sulfonate/bicarbonate transport system ATPase subunit